MIKIFSIFDAIIASSDHVPDSRVETAAATRSCFLRSLDASGNSRFLSRSERDMSATRQPSSLTIGSLAFLLSIRMRFASSSDKLTGATVRSVVITSLSLVVWSATKSTSRLVTMPNSLPPIRPVSVMGTPEKPLNRLMSRTSATVWLGVRHSGSVMKPFLKRLTLRTSRACSSGVLL